MKLMAAVGALLGPLGVVKAFILTAFIGAAYAIAVLAVNQWRSRSAKSAVRARSMISRGSDEGQTANNTSKRPVLCYGVAIASGTLLSLLENVCFR